MDYSSLPYFYSLTPYSRKRSTNSNLKTKPTSHPTQQRACRTISLSALEDGNLSTGLLLDLQCLVGGSPTTKSVQLAESGYLHAIAQFLPQVKAERSIEQPCLVSRLTGLDLLE